MTKKVYSTDSLCKLCTKLTYCLCAQCQGRDMCKRGLAGMLTPYVMDCGWCKDLLCMEFDLKTKGEK